MYKKLPKDNLPKGIFYYSLTYGSPDRTPLSFVGHSNLHSLVSVPQLFLKNIYQIPIQNTFKNVFHTIDICIIKKALFIAFFIIQTKYVTIFTVFPFCYEPLNARIILIGNLIFLEPLEDYAYNATNGNFRIYFNFHFIQRTLYNNIYINHFGHDKNS